MRISYDPAVDAMYIYLSDKKSTRTETISDDLMIDYSGKKLIGIEILGVSEKIAKGDLKSIETIVPSSKASPLSKDWAKIRKLGKQTAKRMGIKTYDDIERIAG